LDKVVKTGVPLEIEKLREKENGCLLALLKSIGIWIA
jgi:hypothetical protein